MKNVLAKNVILFLTFIMFSVLLLHLSSNIVTANHEKKVIYLDPGHGGFDGGCVNQNLAIIEKDITLKISEKLKLMLEQTGFVVYLTRQNDNALAENKRDDILERVSMITKVNPYIYVSIHANSYPSHFVRGAQVFYRYNESELLAKTIQNNLKNLDPSNKRIEKKLDGKYLLDHIYTIGCLVEVGFLSNNEEAEQLNNDFYQSMIAYAIYTGIMEYIENGE